MSDRARELDSYRVEAGKVWNEARKAIDGGEEIQVIAKALRTAEQRGLDLASEHGHTFLNGDMKEQCICGFILGNVMTIEEVRRRQREHIRSLIGSSPAPDTDREKRLVAFCLRLAYDVESDGSKVLAAFNESEAKSTEAK